MKCSKSICAEGSISFLVLFSALHRSCKYTAIASGIFMTMVFGCAVMMGIQGYVADLFGYLSSFWVVMFCAAYLLF